MDKKSSLLWTIIVAAILVVGALLAFAWLRDDDNATDVTSNNATNTVEETVDDDLLSQIVDNPSEYYGQNVTVRGEIQDIYDNRVFSISDQTVGDELLIVTKRALTAEEVDEAEEFFEDNADVRATGTIRQFVVADIETEYDLDLTDELEIELADRPVLIADSFTYSDNKALFDFNQGP